MSDILPTTKFSTKITNGIDGILVATLEGVISLFAYKNIWKIFRDCQQLTICKQCNSEYFQWEKYRKKKTFNLSMQQLKRIYCCRMLTFHCPTTSTKNSTFRFTYDLEFNKYLFIYFLVNTFLKYCLQVVLLFCFHNFEYFDVSAIFRFVFYSNYYRS